MDMSSISHFIELSQVGQMFNSTVWLHNDPVSIDNDPVAKTEVLFEACSSYATCFKSPANGRVA